MGISSYLAVGAAVGFTVGMVCSARVLKKGPQLGRCISYSPIDMCIAIVGSTSFIGAGVGLSSFALKSLQEISKDNQVNALTTLVISVGGIGIYLFAKNKRE